MEEQNIMVQFFASIYEWFGLNLFYDTNLGEELRGYNMMCDGEYNETKWYLYVGWGMVIITILGYVMQYHIVDSPRYKSKGHWWLFALLIVLLNFFIAFFTSFNEIESNEYCSELVISRLDCLGFGVSNGIWCFLFFILLTSFSYPRAFSINCRYTTFWKP